jgi:hypothetical protein
MGQPIEHKKVRVRSPAYPSLNLKTSIERARTIYAFEKRQAAPVAVVTKHCGFDIKSGGGMRLISALKQFGLVIEQGVGEDRKVKLSDRALDILLAPTDQSPHRLEAIKTAAMSPKIHKMVWEEFKGELPSDATIKAYLIRDLEFNDAKVDAFIKEFRSTIEFANIKPTDIIESAGEGEEENPDDEDQDSKGDRQHRRRSMQPGTKEDVFTLEEGQVILQWPENLSQESFEDFESWLALIIRKAKRSVRSPQEEDDDT